MFSSRAIFDTVSLAVIFIISISLHEYAHALASSKLWDPTPKIQGRLTPNPLVHIDPIGFIMIFLIKFGWGRPVIVNPSYYKNPLRDELIVALAWPAVNILLSIAWIIIKLIYLKIVWIEQFFANDPIVVFWNLFAWINVSLAIFNLIPLPPLDGYRIVKYLKPSRWYRLEKNMRIIAIIFLAMILIPTPLQWVIWWFISIVSSKIYSFIHVVLTLMFW